MQFATGEPGILVKIGALFLVEKVFTEKKNKIKINIIVKPIVPSLRSESKM
jgi:hypothetical protein